MSCKHSKKKASKLIEDEENGAENCSACLETPRCLRHGTTHARNSKIEKAHMCFMMMAVHVWQLCAHGLDSMKEQQKFVVHESARFLHGL